MADSKKTSDDASVPGNAPSREHLTLEDCAPQPFPSQAPDKVKFHLFEGVYQQPNSSKVKEYSQDEFLDRFSEVKSQTCTDDADKLKGTGVVLAQYKPNAVSKHYSQLDEKSSTSILMLDIDKLAPQQLPGFEKKLESLNCAAYSTYKHRTEAPRLRVAVGLDKPVGNYEESPFREVYNAVVAYLGIQVDGNADKRANLYFLPQHHPDHKDEIISRRFRGKNFDTSKIDLTSLSVDDFQAYGAQDIPEGTRNSTLTSKAGSLINMGFRDEKLKEELQKINLEFCKPPVSDNEIASIVKSSVNFKSAQKNYSDLGNGERFAAACKNRAIFSPGLGWLAWDGKRWKRDESNLEVRALAHRVARSINEEASHLWDKDERARLFKHALKSEDVARIDAMLKSAQPKLRCDAEVLDTDPLLLNVSNGTVDFKTGVLRPHNPADLITKLAPVDSDPTTPTPVFDAFFERILQNRELRDFMLRAIGYSATGMVNERVFFFCYGGGANGKSTLIELIVYLLGDYAKTSQRDLLMRSRSGEQKTGELIDLKGARFVASQESAENSILDEAKVKALTGGDSLTDRYLYQQNTTWLPTHKLWLSSNHRPRIKEAGEALWDRLHEIPFEVRIPENERDRDLLEKLKQEAPGIMAKVVVKGAMDWYLNGLQPPVAVKNAVSSYKADEDIVGRFLDERCERVEGFVTTSAELFAEFTRYLESVGERSHINQQSFGQRLGQKGFKNQRTNRGASWVGIKIVELTRANSFSHTPAVSRQITTN